MRGDQLRLDPIQLPPLDRRQIAKGMMAKLLVLVRAMPNARPPSSGRLVFSRSRAASHLPNARRRLAPLPEITCPTASATQSPPSHPNGYRAGRVQPTGAPMALLGEPRNNFARTRILVRSIHKNSETNFDPLHRQTLIVAFAKRNSQ